METVRRKKNPEKSFHLLRGVSISTKKNEGGLKKDMTKKEGRGKEVVGVL